MIKPVGNNKLVNFLNKQINEINRRTILSSPGMLYKNTTNGIIIKDQPFSHPYHLNVINKIYFAKPLYRRGRILICDYYSSGIEKYDIVNKKPYWECLGQVIVLTNYLDPCSIVEGYNNSKDGKDWYVRKEDADSLDPILYKDINFQSTDGTAKKLRLKAKLIPSLTAEVIFIIKYPTLNFFPHSISDDEFKDIKDFAENQKLSLISDNKYNFFDLNVQNRQFYVFDYEIVSQ